MQTLRRLLEAKAKELKDEIESPLKIAILQAMQDDGVQSLHYPDIGRIICSVRSHYEVIDKDAFMYALSQSIIEATREGRPLSEAMLAQYRPSKEILEDFQHSGLSMEECGVRKVDQQELSIRK